METAHPNMLILYVADYFDHSRANDIFEHERQIAHEMGFATALFDFDSGHLFSVDDGSELDLGEDLPPFEGRKSLYRGWPVKFPVLLRRHGATAPFRVRLSCHVVSGVRVLAFV